VVLRTINSNSDATFAKRPLNSLLAVTQGELTPMLDQPIESLESSALMQCTFVRTTSKYGQHNVGLLILGFDPLEAC